MRKMSNKGVTLVELIVSFAIVGVAIVYFYQTVSTVSKLYKTSKDDTNEYVNATYVLRLMDAYCNENTEIKYPCGNATTDEQIEEINDFCEKIYGDDCSIEGLTAEPQDSVRKGNKYYKTLKMKIGGKDYNLLALVTTPKYYVINFYDNESDLTPSSVLSSPNTLKIDDPGYKDRCFTDEVVNINEDEKNITCKLNYKAKDSDFSVEYGIAVNTSDIEAKVEPQNTERGEEYIVDVYLQKGNLFSYTGDYDFTNEEGNNWNIKFKTTGNLTINVPITIDAFLVGGGAGGASSSKMTNTYAGAGGGSGGVAITQEDYAIEKNTYSLTIGAGGSGGTSAVEAGNGGTTLFKYKDSAEAIFSAVGGEAPSSSNRKTAKGNGGSGGYDTYNNPVSGTAGTNFQGIVYGSGGSGGIGCSVIKCNTYTGNAAVSGGGAGGTNSNKNGGNATTPGSGGGGAGSKAKGGAGSGGSGASGIIIIRNAR